MSAARWIICACLAYIMIRPVSANAVLLAVLGVLAVTCAAIIIYERRRPAPEVLLSLAAVITVGLLGLILGIGNPGIVDGLVVWVAAPLIFGAFAFAGDGQLLRMALWTSAITTVAVGMLILLFIGGERGLVPEIIPTWLQSELGLFLDKTITDGIAIRFFGLSTFVGSASLWFTAALLPSHASLPPKWVVILAALSALAVTLMAGRSALVLVSIVGPIAAWVSWRALTRKEPRAWWRSLVPVIFMVATAASIAISTAAGNATVVTAMRRLLSLFTGDGQSADERVRVQQAEELIAAWWQSPVFGHGFGATIEGYARSERQPWDFELQYHLILFQVGIIGASMLLAAAWFIAMAMVRATRESPQETVLILVVSAAALAMIVANASNPYLQAPGHMWPVYLLLMSLNVILTRTTLLRPKASATLGTPTS